MKIIPLDASRLINKEASHKYLASVLHFPSYYGHNLDALADALSEIDRDVGIIFHATGKYGNYSENIINVFIEILGDERILVI